MTEHDFILMKRGMLQVREARNLLNKQLAEMHEMSKTLHAQYVLMRTIVNGAYRDLSEKESRTDELNKPIL